MARTVWSQPRRRTTASGYRGDIVTGSGRRRSLPVAGPSTTAPRRKRRMRPGRFGAVDFALSFGWSGLLVVDVRY